MRLKPIFEKNLELCFNHHKANFLKIFHQNHVGNNAWSFFKKKSFRNIKITINHANSRFFFSPVEEIDNNMSYHWETKISSSGAGSSPITIKTVESFIFSLIEMTIILKPTLLFLLYRTDQICLISQLHDMQLLSNCFTVALLDFLTISQNLNFENFSAPTKLHTTKSKATTFPRTRPRTLRIGWYTVCRWTRNKCTCIPREFFFFFSFSRKFTW